MSNEALSPNSQQPGIKALRPWYRIHFSTLSVLAVVLAGFVFINIPGDRTSLISNRFYHGWPYHYYEREGTQHSYWSFTGTTPQFHVEALLLNLLTAFCLLALTACASELWIRRNGRLFRFGMRSLLGLTALIAVTLGLAMRDLHHCYRQQATITELAKLGSVTAFRDRRPYDWFRILFGDHFHGTIDLVSLTSSRRVDRLPDLRSLTHLESLWLELPGIPENIEQVSQLPSLKGLNVTLTKLTIADRERLRRLTQMPQLYGLGLLGEDVDDDAVLQISPHSQLEYVSIGSSKITDRGISRLSELKMLTNLTLEENLLKGQDWSAFSKFPKLSFLNLIGGRLAPGKVADGMVDIWPNARIVPGTSAIAPTSSVWKTSIRILREQ
jgi:hypothetical protein